MTTHEVEVRPYGTKNEASTFSTTGTQRETTTVEVKPPYGQRNEVEIRAQGTQQQQQYPTSSTSTTSGSRYDTEVRPYGGSEYHETVYKPQTTSSQRTTTTRPLDMDSLKNPLLATALGITLALLLLSLSHLPKMASNWWHRNDDHSLMKPAYDAYDTYVRSHHTHPREYRREYNRDYNRDYDRDYSRDYGRDYSRDYGREASWRAGEVYQAGKEKASQMYQNVKDTVEGTGESIYNRARDAVVGRPGDRDYYSGSGSITDEARRAACRTAERARDMACDYNPSSSSSWFGGGGRDTMDYARDRGQNMMDRGRDYVDSARYQARDAMDNARWQARDTQENVANRAQGIYESAKRRASDLLESAKDTVTYPVRAAQHTVSHTGENVRDAAANTYERARDTVVNTGEQARGAAGSTFQAAKDTVYNAKEAVKDTVLGAGETVRNVAGDAVQGVKDTVVGAGQAVKERLTTSRADNLDDVHYQEGDVRRGPTKVKVEVQEL